MITNPSPVAARCQWCSTAVENTCISACLFQPLSRHSSLSTCAPSQLFLCFIYMSPPTFILLNSFSPLALCTYFFLPLKIHHASPIRWPEHERQVSGNHLSSPERARFSLHWVCSFLSLSLNTVALVQIHSCKLFLFFILSPSFLKSFRLGFPR